jgi:hypothetical protein
VSAKKSVVREGWKRLEGWVKQETHVDVSAKKSVVRGGWEKEGVEGWVGRGERGGNRITARACMR